MSSNIGVKKYPENVAADSKMKSQPAMKTLRTILGLSGFYRRFIQVFGKIADRLYKLLNKNNVFLGAKSVKKQLKNWSKQNRKTVFGFSEWQWSLYVKKDEYPFSIGANISQRLHFPLGAKKWLHTQTKSALKINKSTLLQNENFLWYSISLKVLEFIFWDN